MTRVATLVKSKLDGEAVKRRFRLGQLVASFSACALGRDRLCELLARHVSGDFGTIADDERLENERSISRAPGLWRVLSTYFVDGRQVVIVTEPDHSLTRIFVTGERTV